jgi:ABC-type dipeptide/oligopeptide/nickel transport system permease subunit
MSGATAPARSAALHRRWWPAIGAAAFLTALGVVAAAAGPARPGASEAIRLLAAARAPLALGLCAAVLSVGAGAVLGSVAALFGGPWQGASSRSLEVLAACPGFVALALAHELAPAHAPLAFTLAVALVRLPEPMRLARSLVLRLRAEEYMTAARALGGSPAGILVRHAAPHLAGPMAQSAALTMTAAVLLEASASYLGVGSPQRAGSWGTMAAAAVAEGDGLRAALVAGAVALTCGACWVLAGAVRDALDPRDPGRTPLRGAPTGRK